MIRFEDFTNHYKKQEKILLGMIDLAITSMVENDLCNYCQNYLDKNATICLNTDLCKSYLFNGLKSSSIQMISEKKDEKDFIE